VWGSGVRPSQFPFLMGSPSLQPRARGAGLPEGHGRARTANRHPPSVGPGCCPGQRRRWPPRIVGGPPGPSRHATLPCGGHGGVSGGLCGWGGPHKPCQGGAGYRAPLWVGCHARFAGRVIQGGRGPTPREATGRPCQCTGGGCGRGGPHKPCRGGAGYGAPFRGGCHARPAGGVIHGGRGATSRKATGRPCQCAGAH